MNMLGPTLILYVLVGAGVATAAYLSPNVTSDRRLNVVLAVPFWPLYLPLLLARPSSAAATGQAALVADEMTAAILQVDQELTAALSTLKAWGADVQPDELERFTTLRDAWIAQADRIRAMDRLLAAPDYAAAADPPRDDDERSGITEQVRQSRRARRENVDQLRQVRRQTYDDLMARLAWVRELTSMIHLARFTGAPTSRARELLAQIAGSGDVGLKETRAGNVDTNLMSKPPAWNHHGPLRPPTATDGTMIGGDRS